MEVNEKFTFAFASYLMHHARELKASETEANRRMEICRGCDKFQLLPPPREEEKEELMKRFGRTESFHGCTECGCFLEDKVEGFFERCPEAKWYPAIHFIMGMEFDQEDGRKGQQGDLERWKEYHEEFMKYYEEKKDGLDFFNWANIRNSDIIEEQSTNDND